MGAPPEVWAPLFVITVFWFVIGGVLPWFVPKRNENRGNDDEFDHFMFDQIITDYF